MTELTKRAVAHTISGFERASADNPLIFYFFSSTFNAGGVSLDTMNTRRLWLAAPLLALMANIACAAVAPGAGKATPGAKPVVVSPGNLETALTKAMPADAVRKILGQPMEIKPMKAPDGKAEVWVYKRETDRHVERVEVGSIPITNTVIGGDGKAHQYKVGEEIQYADLHCATEETVQLLMFNDHLVVCKISRQESRRYN